MSQKKKKVFDDAIALRKMIDDMVASGEMTEAEAQIQRNELVRVYNIVTTQMHHRQRGRF